MSTVLQRLNGALHEVLASDPSVFFLGEDVLDPYGGAFKVAAGLSTRFPQRVLTTPVSEGAIAGVATGLAVRGCRAVAEIMFGDFLTLTADILINSASKFRWLYGGDVRVPIVVRAPMGGRRGYGPTHSQSLEKHFLGVPGLRVVAPHAFADPGALLAHAVLADDDPVLFIEHKLLYGCGVREGASAGELTIERPHDPYGPTRLSPPAGCAPRVTFACYGYMAELVCEAMNQLVFEHELFTEAVIFSQLSPPDLVMLGASAGRSRHLVTVEEGSGAFGWGGELVARLTDQGVGLARTARVAGRECVVPSSRVLEAAVLPDVEDIVARALQICGRDVSAGER